MSLIKRYKLREIFYLPDKFFDNQYIQSSKNKRRMNEYNYLFKMIVIGDTGVGKSCIVLQFIQNQTRLSHDVTIGVEFGSKTIAVGNKSIKLQIWDTAGQQNFRSITRSYYRSAIGAMLVYDITRRQSFEHLTNWLDQVKLNGNPYMEILLIGNKNDLTESRDVSFEEGEKLARQKGLNFMQINSRDHMKVESAFKKIAQNILAKVQEGNLPLNQSIGVKRGDEQKPVLTDVKKKKKKQKCEC